MKQKIIIKVDMNCEKCRVKTMQIAATAPGVSTVSMKDDTVTVEGNEVDSVALTGKLRKKVGSAKLIGVEEVKEKKKDEGAAGNKDKKDEGGGSKDKKDGGGGDKKPAAQQHHAMITAAANTTYYQHPYATAANNTTNYQHPYAAAAFPPPPVYYGYYNPAQGIPVSDYNDNPSCSVM